MNRVYKKFNKLGYKEDGSILKESSRKNKKWMVLNPETNKFIHFGDSRYDDYTIHRDKQRRDNYRNRMRRFKDADRYSPGYLSYHLLW